MKSVSRGQDPGGRRARRLSGRCCAMAVQLLVAAGVHQLVADHSDLGLGGHTASSPRGPESPCTSHSQRRVQRRSQLSWLRNRIPVAEALGTSENRDPFPNDVTRGT